MERKGGELTLFERALTLDPAERQRFLESACGGDRILLARVQRMLRADRSAHGLLDRRPDELLPDLRPSKISWIGRTFGPYRLLRELGRGGMGIVYLAERADVGARVALKLVAGGITSPERSARFEYERPVLARLDHPHIAHFLDAGVADDGTLWLALEYVEGSPIDVHCDARCLGVPARLALLEQVADAVAYAHSSLLVHRDLKPSNILVSDAGVPKLVDFGIAKLLGDGAADGSLTADTAAVPLTPDYASPEQLRGEPVTTASDVYQLGILLHELLTGRRVTDGNGDPLRYFVRAAGAPMMRPSSLVRTEVNPEQLPAGLSTRTAHELAALRGVTPQQLRRRLAGDLDAIIETALQPRPARRYESARDLADELRRHRTGRPVNARAASVAYRTERFVRRHAIASALAAGIVTLITVSAVILLMQSRHLAAERDRAEQVAGVLERLFRHAIPGMAPSDSAVSRQMLGEVAAEGRARLGAEPEGWGRILLSVADVYRQLGAADTALLLTREVIGALEPHVPPSHPVLLEAQSMTGIALVMRGEIGKGMAVLERMLGHARTLPDERREELVDGLSYAGFGRQVDGDDDGAKRLYEEALRLALTLPDSAGITYDRTLVNLGFLSDRQGYPDRAEALFRQALARRMARDGPESGSTANAMTSLARVLLARDAVDEAAALADSVYAVRTRHHDPPHTLLADALVLRSAVLQARGRFAEAEALAREATAMQRQVYGENHLQAAWAAAHVVRSVAGQGRIAEAVMLQRDVLARYVAAVGEQHPATLAATVRLAELHAENGRSDEAERLYRSALPVLESLTPGRPTLTRPLTGFGLMLAGSGRCEEAAPYLRRGLRVAYPRSAEDRAWVARARAAQTTCETARRSPR